MATEVHNVGLILAAVIIEALLLNFLLGAFRSKHASVARLVANLVANGAVAIFTGREAFQAFARGGVFFTGLGVALAVMPVSAAALAGVFAWALARDRGELQDEQSAAFAASSQQTFQQEFKDALNARREGDVTALVRFMQRRSDASEDPVRRFATRSLGALKNPLAVDALLGVLDDPEFDIRAAAIESLRRIGDKRAALPLTDRVALTTSEAEIALLLNALRALDAQPATDDARRLAAHPNPRVRRALTQATTGRPKWFALRR